MKRLATFYLILLHLALAVMLWKSDFLERVASRLGMASLKPEITDDYRKALRYHSRSVDALPDASVIFIGDSMIQGLAVTAVHPLGLSYGIGGDTTRGVLARLPLYMPALKRAKAVVFAVGFNDARYRTADEAIRNYISILDALPPDLPVVVAAILPIDDSLKSAFASRGEWIQSFNSQLKALAAQRQNIAFVDSRKRLDTDGDDRLDAPFHDGDGMHLNSAGNLLWAADLRAAILQRP
ncbi:MAG: GDSL-type esterase/lipase family protein [Verrucomicrobiota bacterium]